MEKSKCDSIDMAAESFAKIMEVIFAEGVKKLYPDMNVLREESPEDADAEMEPLHEKEPLHEEDSPQAEDPLHKVKQIGYHMGKWIYLIDAVDDIEENIQSGSYNPLLYRFSYDAAKESPAEFRKRIEDGLRFNLFHYLAVTSNCVSTLDIKKNQGIIDNIIYLGLNRKTEEIIAGVEKKKEFNLIKGEINESI